MNETTIRLTWFQRLHNRWRVNTWHDRFWMWFVWRLPRKLVYFAVIRVWAHGTTGDYGNTHPDELGWSEALRRWARKAERTAVNGNGSANGNANANGGRATSK